MSKLYITSLLLLSTLLCLAVFHSRGMDASLRFSRVAEGNISKAVESIWDNGLDSYLSLVRGDAEAWGRIRPLHNLYHSLPFAFSMFRSGDLFWEDAVPINKRINGDLQSHTIFQMMVTVATIAALGLTLYIMTGQLWVGFLFGILASASMSLAENLLIFYADSGEIGQLFFIAIYLLLISSALKGLKPGVARELCSIIFLFLAYAMKETTVVLTPVVVFVLGIRLMLDWPGIRGYSSFVARHILVHVVFAATLLGFVMAYRSGAYVGEHYATSTNTAELVATSWRLMGKPAGTLLVIILGVLISLLASCARSSPDRDDKSTTSGRWLLSLVFSGLASGFWLINVPWSVPLVKYYLPGSWFLTAAALSVSAIAAINLKRAGFLPAAILWVLGVSIFFVQDLPAQRTKFQQYYLGHYLYRRAVPEVSRDVASKLKDDKAVKRVLIVGPPLYQEGALPFQRTMNRTYKVNIIQHGQVVSSVGNTERNYFRRYGGRGGVEADFVQVISGRIDHDYVYMLGEQSDKTYQTLLDQGYDEGRAWSTPDGYTLSMYAKGNLL